MQFLYSSASTHSPLIASAQRLTSAAAPDNRHASASSTYHQLQTTAASPTLSLAATAARPLAASPPKSPPSASAVAPALHTQPTPLFQTPIGGGPEYPGFVPAAPVSNYAHVGYGNPNYLGGDVNTGQRGDTGAFNGVDGNQSYNSINSQLNNFGTPLSFVGQVQSDLNSNQDVAAEQTVYNNADWLVNNINLQDTAFLAVGYSDLAAGVGNAALSLGAATASAAGVFGGIALGGFTGAGAIAGGIDMGVQSLNYSEKAYNDFTSPAAEAALASGWQSVLDTASYGLGHMQQLGGQVVERGGSSPPYHPSVTPGFHPGADVVALLGKYTAAHAAVLGHT